MVLTDLTIIQAIFLLNCFEYMAPSLFGTIQDVVIGESALRGV